MPNERPEALRTRIAETVPGLPTPELLPLLLAELAAETETATQASYIDARGIYSVFGPAEGEAVLQAFEAAAAGNAVLTRALRWLNQPSPDGAVGGVNLGDPATRAMIDQLTGPVFSADQAATLKARGETTVPRWPGISLVELQELYRPEWEELYRAEQVLLEARAAEILGEYETTLQEDAPAWAAYQATPNARSQARRDALELADAELREEGAIRG